MNNQSSQSLIKRLFSGLFWVTFTLIIVFLLFYRLDDKSKLWWDEGWTLSAARNWIEHGHLENYLDGVPIPPRIPMRFPVVVPVALSMRILGVGTWQGRLPGVIFTLLSLGLVVYLSSQMYDRRTGLATLLVILCLSPYVFHPIYMGRQVLAEMPMMFYLFGGYCMVWLALTRSPAWGVGAALLFGIGFHAKLQVPPFWLVSIALAIWMCLIHRQRRLMLILVGVAVVSTVVAVFVYWLQNLLMPGSFADPALINILFNTSGVVLVWSVRWRTLYIALIFALPQLLGFIWAGRNTLRTLFASRKTERAPASLDQVCKDILRAALWGLGASWLVWYLTMSMYWIRYLFPSFFIGCIFITAYVGELTAGFDLRLVVRRASALLLRREFNRRNAQAAVILLAFSLTLGLALTTIRINLVDSKLDPELASTYLRNNIPTGALVETFESELFFLAPEVKYHFPSDLVSMQLFRRATIDPQILIDYDPLAANPDYLVVGPFAQNMGLYQDVLDLGWFQLEADVGGYQIYHIQKSPLAINFAIR